MTASVYAQPLTRPRPRNPNVRSKEPPHPAAMREKMIESSRGKSTQSATEMRAKGYADEARRRNVYTERRRASRERKEFKKQYEPDGVRALREVPVWLPDKDVEAIAADYSLKSEDVAEWLTGVKWGPGVRMPASVVDDCTQALLGAGVLEQGEVKSYREVVSALTRDEPLDA